MNTIDDLLASIKMANNGYLFAPSAKELAIAAKYPDVVNIRNGQIHLAGVNPHHTNKQYGKLTAHYPEDIPDYEGMILARQEKYFCY